MASRPKKDEAHPVDSYVGNRLRVRRVMLGMSQDAIAQKIGISFQQIQKYEKGVNRVSASRMHQLSQLLDVPIAYFFEGFEYTQNDEYGNHTPSLAAEETAGFEHEKITSRETIELIRAYYSLKDEKTRKRFMDLLRSIADENNDE